MAERVQLITLLRRAVLAASALPKSREVLISVTAQQRVVGGVLVQITQRWVVEARAIEEVSGGLREHRDQSDVHDFCGLFTQDVNAQQAHIFAAKQQLQETGFVSHDAAAR